MAKIKKLSNNKLRRLNTLADKAMALAGSGEFRAAINTCNKADGEHKNFPYIMYARGLISANQMEHKPAAEWFGKAYLADPKPVEFQINYAACLLKAGLAEDAANMYQLICAKSPRLFEAHIGYAATLVEIGEYRQSLQFYQKALNIRPYYDELIVPMASLYNQFGELQKATTLLNKTHKDASVGSLFQSTLGTILLQHGMSNAGIEHLHQALALNPHNVCALCLLINRSKNKKEYDSYLFAIHHLYESLERDSESWPLTAFELGVAANKAGQYEEAFSYWDEANHQNRKHVVFSEEMEDKLHQTAIKAFPASRFLEQITPPNHDKAPIFIVGMPRSGSTLLEQSIARHPALHATEETKALRQAVCGRKRKATYQLLFDRLTQLSDEELLNITQEYERIQAEEYGNQGRIVDKMLDNYIFAGLIAKIYPQARIIHINREPMASCLSMYQQSFANGVAYSYNLDELGRQYARYQRVMQHWREVLPGGVLLVLNYEDLVNNPEGELKRLLEGCNLEWHEDCLSAHNASGKVTTASMDQVRQPIHKKSVDRWKHYKKQLTPIKQYLLD